MSEKNATALKSADFKKILRTHCLKATPRRALLLDVLHRERRPLSVESIHLRLKGRVNEVTIYRALEALVEKGVVMRIGLSNIREYYELAPLGKEHHHHLVCTGCGAIEDVHVSEPRNLEKKVLSRSRHFKEITAHTLEFFGKCGKCVTR